MNASRDARVVNDFGVIARAIEFYATVNSGAYQNALSVAGFGNELKLYLLYHLGSGLMQMHTP